MLSKRYRKLLLFTYTDIVSDMQTSLIIYIKRKHKSKQQ